VLSRFALLQRLSSLCVLPWSHTTHYHCVIAGARGTWMVLSSGSDQGVVAPALPRSLLSPGKRPINWLRVRLGIYALIFMVGLLVFGIVVVNPTFAPRGKTPGASASPEELKTHVGALTGLPRSRQRDHLDSLNAAAAYIRAGWTRLGLTVEELPYQVGGRSFLNLTVSFGPKEAERIIIGAHYDVCGDQPGADDNASGVAGLLELARLLTTHPVALGKRVDLVAYSTEEPPYFGSYAMGSSFHARGLKNQGVKVALMLSLEMIGFFSERSGSQTFPTQVFKLFYPTRGDYVVLVGRLSEWGLMRTIKPMMQAHTEIAVYSTNAPTRIPGIDWSDHFSYWEVGYPALMVTDTSFLRNPNYHKATDTLDTLDFNRMAQVVDGVYGVATTF